MEEQFLDYHRKLRPKLKGFISGSMIRTGGQSFCLVGEWRSFKSIVAARPQMHTMLDAVRDMLEDLGSGMGLTDPVSGDVAVKLNVPKAAKAAKTSKAKAKPAKAKAKTKAKAKAKPTAGKRTAAKKR